MGRELAFVKGHGTLNDFVLIPDDAGVISLSDENVASICDRRAGIGADGILRVVRTENFAHSEFDANAPSFFMDYRNADGSLAEMCGNGARVFARYLWSTGREESPRFSFATRAGIVHATIHDDATISISMGTGEFRAEAARVAVNGVTYPAQGVDIPNPHAVVLVDSVSDVGELNVPPHVEPLTLFPHGVNVEFAHIREPGVVNMRVFERGVGETMSCGTGACAVALVAAQVTGFSGPWLVHVPGGSLLVEIDHHGAVVLRGPAELVARGTVLLA